MDMEEAAKWSCYGESRWGRTYVWSVVWIVWWVCLSLSAVAKVRVKATRNSIWRVGLGLNLVLGLIRDWISIYNLTLINNQSINFICLYSIWLLVQSLQNINHATSNISSFRIQSKQFSHIKSVPLPNFLLNAFRVCSLCGVSVSFCKLLLHLFYLLLQLFRLL